jgi:glutaminyl-peptide cyclotransferase
MCSVTSRGGRLTLALAAMLLSVACQPYYNAGLLPRSGPALKWTLVRSLPHDESSFTQGLAFVDGQLFESAGGFHDSRVMKIDRDTGAVIAVRPWPVAIMGTLQNPFAEGMASDGKRLVQLSWKNQRALTWSLDLERGPDLSYAGDGWGLCFDGTGYWRSDGSSRLHRHRRDDLAESKELAVDVTSHGEEVDRLNELECIDGLVFANVWKTPFVVVIRPADGHVIGVLDFTSLVEDVDASGHESVLNGIAWDPSRRELYVTGKEWRALYVVRLGA